MEIGSSNFGMFNLRVLLDIIEGMLSRQLDIVAKISRKV